MIYRIKIEKRVLDSRKMDPLPVTLIVKAPNQQFEDQTIKCEPTWSIRKLKGYLTEVYPCNPVSSSKRQITITYQ